MRALGSRGLPVLRLPSMWRRGQGHSDGPCTVRLLAVASFPMAKVPKPKKPTVGKAKAPKAKAVKGVKKPVSRTVVMGS